MLLAGTLTATAEPMLRGTVVDAVTGEPVAGAQIYGSSETPVTSAADGSFALPAGGVLALTVIDGAYDVAVVDVGEGALVIALTPRTGEVIEIVGERQLDTPGAVRVERAQLQVIPGSRGDLLSGIKNLPGIANNGSLTPLSSGLIIRGSSPEDSRILIDGFEIPVLYHFLGVQSVLPTEMLSNLEYLPGSYGVAYGRAAGGIVAATSRDEPEREGGFAELSFVNVAGLLQGRIGRRASYAVAARRSVIDAILPAVLPDDSGLAFTVYPRYYDYQAKLTYQPRERWKLSAFAFGSDDRIELATDGDNAADPVASGQLSNATSFTRVIASARYRRPGLQVDAGTSAYTDTNHFRVGSERFLLLDRDGVAARFNATWEVSRRIRTVVGAEADVTRTGYDIKFVRPPREGDPRGPNFTQDALIETTGANTFRDLATWMATTVFPIPQVELTGGARVDSYLRNRETVVQPRGEAIWRVVDGSTIRAAGGLYTRPPEFLDQGLQPELDPVRVLQTSAGVEQRLTPWLTASATAFYHRMSDLIVLPADRRDPASLGGYENLGRGDARGIELRAPIRCSGGSRTPAPAPPGAMAR